MHPRLRTALLSVVLAVPFVGPARAGDAPAFDERGANTFFTDPDAKTRARIFDLIHRFSSDGVRHRWEARSELESIGFWAVEPLIEAVRELESPVKCASILTLEAIGDRRAVAPLRQAIVDNSSRPYVPGFATLALGRFRDPETVATLTGSLDTSRSLATLRVAAPLALARIRTDAARDLLLEQFDEQHENEPVRTAQLLALGFFPDAAVDHERRAPGKQLARGLESRRSGERVAAVLGFLVATGQRRESRDFLLQLFDKADDHDVRRVALLGVSRLAGTDVTLLLARTAADKRADDDLRILALDLLAGRGDPAAKSDVLKLLRSTGDRQLRASAVVAAASMPDDECAAAVLSRLEDTAPLVRAGAALGCTRFVDPAARAEALKQVEARIRQGERSSGVRRVLRFARALLAGERAAVDWSRVESHPLFQGVDADYEDRLLWEVNLLGERCLDLRKITNEGSDTQLTNVGPPGEHGAAPPEGASESSSTDDGSSGGDTASDGGLDDGTDTSTDSGEDVSTDGPGEAPPDRPVPDATNGGNRPGTAGPIGAARTSDWPELRDLKRHLRRYPYFGREDLPPEGDAATPR